MTHSPRSTTRKEAPAPGEDRPSSDRNAPAPATGGRPFEAAWHLALPHGLLSAVHLPRDAPPVPEPVLQRLHPEEARHARTLRGHRQVDWVGGRLAARTALGQLRVQVPPLLPGDGGGIALPEDLALSVSHKKGLAVALGGFARGGTLGVDLEAPLPARPQVATRVLTAAEQERVEALEPDRRWTAILLRFSIKEAIYKALHPHVRRYVGFQEAEVHPRVDETAEVTLHLREDESPSPVDFQVDAHYRWIRGWLVTTVRILPQR